MRLFWQEMRKIWRPGILAALVVVGVLFYFLRPKFWIERISETQSFDHSLMLVDRYGPVLTAGVRPELDSMYDEIVADFDRELKNIPEAVEAGITDLESYLAAERDGSLYEIDRRAYTELWQLFMTVNDFGIITGRYDSHIDGTFGLRNSPHLAGYTPQAQARIIELEEAEVRTGTISFMDHFVPEYTADWGRYLTVWSVLSVILLLSPTLVRDRLRRTNAMQRSEERRVGKEC